MTYTPAIPISGLAGWSFLQRTYDAQFSAFSSSGALRRDTEYFSEKIQDVSSAGDLVADRRLLSVALGAFGLDDDLNNRYFIQKVLEDGTASDDALANRISDERYRKLSEAFGLGPGQLRKTTDSSAMSELVSLYRTAQFELSVGSQDESMRIALYAERELEQLAKTGKSDDAQWFTLMSQPPLRSMFETALGLPPAFGRIDLDQQLGILREKTRAVTGSDKVSQFAEPETLSKLVTVFHARSQIGQLSSGGSSAANALVLLQSIGR